mmetsp:Transcript_19469/g.42580  ORF Transcript_19469/g.42580 Transcript_19469/m.42580 type:complete len:325 (-) Transcript_19469:162-1136(-)
MARAQAFDDDLCETLHSAGLRCELLVRQGKQEVEILSRFRALGEGQQLQPKVRMIVAKFFELLRLSVGADRSMWFDAMTMIDLLALRSRILVSQEALPLTCTALFRLLLKTEFQGMGQRVSASNLLIAGFCEQLEAFEAIHPFQVVSSASLSQREVAIFGAFDWRFPGSTSGRTWLQNYMSRVDAISAELIQPSLKEIWRSTAKEIWDHTMNAVCKIVLQIACSYDSSPRQTANGLILYGLMLWGLVPAMRTDFQEDESRAVRELFSVDEVIVTRAELDVYEQASFLELLETATCCSLEELAADARCLVDDWLHAADADARRHH